MRLNDKVAIITASGSGMGRAGAELFAREGAKVVAADINLASVQEVVKGIKAAGGEAIAVAADVGKIPDLERVIKVTLDAYKKINILWNHAGTPGPAGLEGVEEAVFDREQEINLRGGFFLARMAVPEMKKLGGGSIIFTSSIAGLVASPMAPLYSVFKGGVVLEAKSLALALAPFNIRVNTICPGPVDTPMLPQFFSRGGTVPDPVAARKAVMANVPLGRIGTPKDIAQLALFFASDESSFVTGVAVPVDGGYCAK